MARNTKYPKIVENFWFVEFANDMKRGRRRKYLSQYRLAEIVGKSPALVSRWESRMSMPTIPDFLFICDVLELSPLKYFVIAEDFAAAEIEPGATPQERV